MVGVSTPWGPVLKAEKTGGPEGHLSCLLGLYCFAITTREFGMNYQQ